MIYKGQNSPIVVELSSTETITSTRMSAGLYTREGKQLKLWPNSSISISGNRITLPLTERETLSFDSGVAFLELKWYNSTTGNIEMVEEISLHIIERFNRQEIAYV